MITKRIIPCLDVRNGRVVKGKNFLGLNDVDSPVKLAAEYSECGADELVFYDITASFEERKIFTEILKEAASNVFIPLTVVIVFFLKVKNSVYDRMIFCYSFSEIDFNSVKQFLICVDMIFS